MKYIESKNDKKSAPNILLTCCVHGDEIFGADFFKYFFKNNIPNVGLLFANEDAYANNVRYIDTDLNRSFDLSCKSKEVEIAKKIKDIIPKYDVVIDIHTTTSKLDMIPIVSNVNKNTLNIIKMLQCEKVVCISETGRKQSLIGQMSESKVGISLEYGEDFLSSKKVLKNEIKKLHNVLDDIYKNGYSSSNNEYKCYQIVGESEKFDTKNMKNFDEIMKIYSSPFYSFLVGEKSYKNKIFLLKEMIRVYPF